MFALRHFLRRLAPVRAVAPAVPPVGRIATHLPAVVLLVVGFWQLPLAAIGTELACIPGDFSDNRLNNYVLEHGYRWATRQEKAFWDAPFLWPTPKATARSDAHIGELPFYAAFRVCGADPERAFQLCVLLFFALNFVSAAWALRQLGLSSVGAAAGAYVFAFGLPVPDHLGNLQLLPRFLVPPAFALAWRLAWQPSWRVTGAFAGCVVGQLYLGMYTGLMLLGVLGIAAAGTLLVHRGRLPWRELLLPGRCEMRKRFAAVALVAVAALPLVIPHLRMARTNQLVPRELLVTFIPGPADWVRPPEVSASWRWLADALPRPGEGRFEIGAVMFPGLVPLAGVAAGLAMLLRPGRRGLAAVAALTSVAVAAVVVRSAAWSPYEAMLDMPLLGTLRGICRVILVLLFPLAVSAGWIVEVIVTGAKGYGTVVAVLALAGVVADQRLVPHDDPHWPRRRYSIAESQARRHRLAEVIREEIVKSARRGPGPRVLYLFPRTDGPGWDYPTQLDAMWAARDAGIPTMNGWTGYVPPGWFQFRNFTAAEVWMRSLGRRLDYPELGVVIFIGTPKGFEDEELEQRLRREIGFREE